MRVNKIFLIGFFFFIFNFAFSQNIHIGGTVVDGLTKDPLKGTDIYLSRSKIGTVSGPDGHFDLTFRTEIPAGDSLVVSYLGYQEFRQALDEFKNGSTIYLEPKSLDLGDEIVVSAEQKGLLQQDIPMAKNTIQAKEIRQYGSNEIADILKPLPSIRIEGNDLDGRKIEIRGSDADEVNVYVDGVLINNMRFDNAADLSIVPVEDIQSVEVVRGGNSTLLGSGAFGGVVNITTKQDMKARYSVTGKLGSFNSHYVLADMNIPVSKKFVINYFGQFNEFSPQIEYFPGERFTAKTTNDNITSSKNNHSLGLNYFTETGQFTGHFIGYFFKYAKPDWNSDYQNLLFSGGYRGNILGAKDFEINVSQLHGNDNVYREPVGSARYVSTYGSNRLNLRVAKKFQYSGGDVQLLTEYYHDDLLTESKIKDTGWETALYHAYLYDNRVSFAGVASFNDYLKSRPNLSWKTYIGLRGDFQASGNRDATHTLGAQLNYELERWQISPYFNYGKNVKYPTLQENAFIQDLTDASHTDTTGQRLKPEYSNSSELGLHLKYYPPRTPIQSMDFSLSLFSRTIYNKLLTRPFDDLIAHVQIGRSNTRGIESSFKINNIFRQFTFGASYIKLKISDPLLYAYKPDENFSTNLNWSTKWGIYFNTTFFYEGKSVAWYYDANNNIQTETISPFNDMDISLGFSISMRDIKTEIQFSGYNILDNSGFKYYYLKKRYLQVSLRFRY